MGLKLKAADDLTVINNRFIFNDTSVVLLIEQTPVFKIQTDYYNILTLIIVKPFY